MLQTLERRRKYIGVILSDEQTRLEAASTSYSKLSFT